MRVLGIDYGTAKVGLALGDTDAKIATPLNVVRAESAELLIASLEATVKSEAIDVAVIGAAAQFSDAIESIRAKLSIPVETVPESYTTIAAKEYREHYPGMEDDAIAAALILEEYFGTLESEV